MLFLLFACTTPTTDTAKAAGCTATTWYADLDGDGFGDAASPLSACEAPATHVADGTDCDDTRASVHPGAVEVCNTTDDDCDGVADEDAADLSTWYADADGDGWGSTPHEACAPATDEVATAGDCDDADASVHPDAAETCNERDDDCDDEVDEDAVDGGHWYGDADGDGWGAGAEVVACLPAAGQVGTDGDCDDADADVNPDADELCNGVDDDCDGTDDEDAAEAPTWYTDRDGDGWGDAARVGCEAEADEVAEPGDCDDRDADVHPGALERCDGANTDEDCDGAADEAGAEGERVWYPDDDRDRYGDDAAASVACDAVGSEIAVGGDCDDTNDAINPGELEWCDDLDIDENCDGVADGEEAADPTYWYGDADGDGYGDRYAAHVACDPAAGEVPYASDCDDTDATISPGAEEWCDDAHVDQNCNGSTDDADAIDAIDWYRDDDDDGFGGSVTLSRCTAPSGYIEAGGDCDDDAPAVFPGATEVCDDEDVDEDCDGLADDADPGVGAPTWYTDGDGDGYGTGAALAVTCADIAGAAPADGDCDDADPAWSPGAADRCGDGLDQDCDGADRTCGLGDDTPLSFADAIVYGEPGESVGHAIALGCDLDGDGVGDLAVSAPYASASFSEDGITSIVPGPLHGVEAVADVAIARVLGGAADDRAGRNVLCFGDLTGDGRDDLLVAAPGLDASTGRVYIMAGPLSGDTTTADAFVTLLGGEGNDMLGYAIGAPTDVNGDGELDWIAGQNGGSRGQMGYVKYGPLSSTVDFEDAEVSFRIDSGTDAIASHVAWAGDADGDGLVDALIAAPGDSAGGESAGTVYLRTGPLSGTVRLDDGASITWTGALYDELGSDILGAGDVDGDGYDEIWAAAYYANTGATNNGGLYLLSPTSSGVAKDVAIASWNGPPEDSSYGFYDVKDAGDVDGDGNADLVASSSYGYGAAWILYGPPGLGTHDIGTDEPTITAAEGESVTADIAGGGDLNGDGFDDVAFSHSGNDTYGTDSGMVWVFYGGPRE